MADLPMTMPHEYEFEGDELVKEMQREFGMRIEVYDRRVAAHTMTRKDADRKIALAAAIIAHLQATALGKRFKQAKI